MFMDVMIVYSNFSYQRTIWAEEANYIQTHLISVQPDPENYG